MDESLAMPADPINVFFEAAVTMHEQYAALIKAGFDQGQALYLVGQILLTGAVANQWDGNNDN